MKQHSTAGKHSGAHRRSLFEVSLLVASRPEQNEEDASGGFTNCWTISPNDSLRLEMFVEFTRGSSFSRSLAVDYCIFTRNDLESRSKRTGECKT